MALIIEFGNVTVTFMAEALTAPGVTISAGVELRGTGGKLSVEKYVVENALEYLPNKKYSKAPAAKIDGTKPTRRAPPEELARLHPHPPEGGRERGGGLLLDHGLLHGQSRLPYALARRLGRGVDAAGIGPVVAQAVVPAFQEKPRRLSALRA